VNEETKGFLEIVKQLEADKVKQAETIRLLEQDKKRLVDRMVDKHYYNSWMLADILEGK
jgi:hypothetical protein